MNRTMRFEKLLQTYWIKDRTLFGLIVTGETATLRFDLYHCDDATRCLDGTEYLLDVSVARDRLRIQDGMVERLRDEFSADILAAEIEGDELRLLADCSFYPAKGNDLVPIVLSGGAVEIEEHAPAAVMPRP